MEGKSLRKTKERMHDTRNLNERKQSKKETVTTNDEKSRKKFSCVNFCHNAQNNNKTSQNPHEIDKKFSTLKCRILREKGTYTPSYTHFPQKKSSK